MLIDTNAYIGHWPFRKMNYNTCEKLLIRMDKHGVSQSIISSLNGIFYKNVQSANEELCEDIQSNKSFRDRFIPFAVINPVFNGWEDDFDVCINKMGMRGVRIYPKYHRYSLDHSSCIALVKKARDKNIPISLDLRMVDSRPSSWLDIETEWSLKDVMTIIRAVPEAKYLIVNVANDTSLSAGDLALIKKADVLMDTSGRAMNALPALMKVFGEDRFCFGTHTPLFDDITGLLRVVSLREEEANELVMKGLRYNNIKRLLSA
jgi:predicted TIM-barrel fold metal-dependent hydrolase